MYTQVEVNYKGAGVYTPAQKPLIWLGCVINVSPKATKIDYDALYSATTHPTQQHFQYLIICVYTS